MYRTVKPITLAFLFTVLLALIAAAQVHAAQLTLSWTDNSTDETGFRIERKTGTSGTYAETALVGANIVSYVDSSLANATNYCYRLRAYNSAGNSSYSNEQCATTASAPTPTSFLLTVNKTGAGTGTVTGTGINCGSDCSESVASGTQVVLSAAPANGSTFAGWTGTGCGSGTVTLTSNVTCTATFNLATFTLTVLKAGNGNGTVTGTGINCGSDCTHSASSGTQVVLSAAPATGSTFASWAGSGCSGGAVTLTTNVTCTATFNSSLASGDRIGVYRPSSGTWFLDTDGNYSWEDDIDTAVQAFTAAASQPVLGDWSQTGNTQLGLFQPSTRQWHLDINNNKAIDGCSIDACEGPFGETNDIAVVGNWNNRGEDRIGVFRPSTGYWYLDKNADGDLDRCKTDLCVRLRNCIPGDLPVVGDWSGNGISQLGLFRPATGEWFLDRNGNRSWDGCRRDSCLQRFGSAGDVPVAGDWNGSGRSHIGVWRPSTGDWLLDYNGNGSWDGCSLDLCVTGFGMAGDIPVVGRW